MARRGDTPTEAAVAAWLDGKRQRRERWQRLDAATAARIESDGPKAAAYVAGVVAGTGEGPTWHELVTAMGWPRKPVGVGQAVIHGLAAAGWLTTGTSARSLRPGPLRSAP
jgi:hypothetical protein